jgi:hypothetical protein
MAFMYRRIFEAVVNMVKLGMTLVDYSINKTVLMTLLVQLNI